MRRARFGLVVMMAGIVLASSLAQAAVTPEQQTKLRAADAAVKKAEILFKGKKFKEAGAAIKEAQDAIGELYKGDIKELGPVLNPLVSKITRAHELLDLQGVSIPAMPAAPAAAAAPAAGGTPVAAGGPISFTKQVAPILSSRCGRCHIMDSKGTFNTATFAALMKGNKDGIVVMPGNSTGSRIIEVIESGDMPRGGAMLAEQVTTLKKWIDEGAKYDGTDQNTPITDFARMATNQRVKLEVGQASGRESVLFARDIGPVLLEHCTGCHGDRQPSGMLGLTTFDRMMRGGDSGLVLVPNNPTDSLLIKKLKGTAGDRMPRRKPPLSDDVIAKFERWIADGAKFDGPDGGKTMPLDELVLLMRATRANHEELAELRSEITAKNWRLMLPDSKPSQAESDHFVFYGNVAPEVLADVSKAAEGQVSKIETMLKADPDKPFIKGKMTFFVFDKRYDYGEIGQMIERREIPLEWKGHWRFTIVDAYGAVLPARSDEYSLASLVGQQIAGVYVASQGKVPHWFAEGSGRAVASKLDLKDTRVKKWDDQMAEIASRSPKPDSFLTGDLPPEEADILSYGYVKFLMGKASAYQQVLADVRGGAPFDQAFTKAYGGSPSVGATAWMKSGGANSTGARGKRGK